MNKNATAYPAIRVSMPDGSKWDVPSDLVAKHRAQYYAKLDTARNPQKNFQSVFQEEFQATMVDEECLIDWAESNMNWSDVRLYAVRVSAPDIDYQDGWVNGEKTIVTSA